jgi:hypothetical protein
MNYNRETFSDITDASVLYVLNHINVEEQSASSARLAHSTSLLSDITEGENGNSLYGFYKFISLFK